MHVLNYLHQQGELKFYYQILILKFIIFKLNFSLIFLFNSHLIYFNHLYVLHNLYLK